MKRFDSKLWAIRVDGVDAKHTAALAPAVCCRLLIQAPSLRTAESRGDNAENARRSNALEGHRWSRAEHANHVADQGAARAYLPRRCDLAAGLGPCAHAPRTLAHQPSGSTRSIEAHRTDASSKPIASTRHLAAMVGSVVGTPSTTQAGTLVDIGSDDDRVVTSDNATLARDTCAGRATLCRACAIFRGGIDLRFFATCRPVSDLLSAPREEECLRSRLRRPRGARACGRRAQQLPVLRFRVEPVPGRS
jgi:hypothetical protein